MTVFDFGLLALIIVSVALAVFRGGMREMATLAALALAAGLAFLLIEPIAGALGGSIFALGGVAAALLLVGFAGFYWLAIYLVGLAPRSNRVALADRIGGGVFGLVRALVLIGLGFLGYAYYLDEDQRAAAVNDALLLPVAKGSAAFVETFAPERRSPLTTSGTENGSDVREPAGDRDRAGLEELVTTVTTDVASGAGAPASPETRATSKGDAGQDDAGDPVAELLKDAGAGR